MLVKSLVTSYLVLEMLDNPTWISRFLDCSSWFQNTVVFILAKT